MTKRQRLEMHRSEPACAGCHALMDPLGFPLENFDAIGKYRTTDNGLPVDPTSTFDGEPVADARASRAWRPARARPSRSAWCASITRYAVGYKERDADGSVLNTRGDPLSRHPASSCGT